jgi:hypothetical protein
MTQLYSSLDLGMPSMIRLYQDEVNHAPSIDILHYLVWSLRIVLTGSQHRIGRSLSDLQCGVAQERTAPKFGTEHVPNHISKISRDC